MEETVKRESTFDEVMNEIYSHIATLEERMIVEIVGLLEATQETQ